MTDIPAKEAATPDVLPKPPRDYLPVLLPFVLAAAMLPLVGSFSSWVTLTVASLAMGMMIFIMASGLTLVFGLMDVLNFGHGAFIAVGAYVSTLVLGPMAGFVQADSLTSNLLALAPAALLAMAVSGALGLVFERVLVLPVYGNHLKQILITMGGLIVAEQAGDADRESDRGQHGGEIEPDDVGLHPGRERQQHQRRHVGADRDEGAVAEIEHVHQAEYEREAGRHDEDHHAHRESRDGQGQPA